MPDRSRNNVWFSIKGVMSAALRKIENYISSSRPLVRANNLLALLVASNQPFYPIYVQLVAGPDGGATFLTLLTTPLFLAVPWLSHRHPELSLASVPVIGLANAILATLALGNAVGFELFILPCLVVAVLVADRETSKLVVPAAISALACFLYVHFADIAPLHLYTDDERASLRRLNQLAVAGLTIYIVYSVAVARWRSR